MKKTQRGKARLGGGCHTVERNQILAQSVWKVTGPEWWPPNLSTHRPPRKSNCPAPEAPPEGAEGHKTERAWAGGARGQHVLGAAGVACVCVRGQHGVRCLARANPQGVSARRVVLGSLLSAGPRPSLAFPVASWVPEWCQPNSAARAGEGHVVPERALTQAQAPRREAERGMSRGGGPGPQSNFSSENMQGWPPARA